jgi:hypothetical protein
MDFLYIIRIGYKAIIWSSALHITGYGNMYGNMSSGNM